MEHDDGLNCEISCNGCLSGIRLAFVDAEIGVNDKKVRDIGAWRYDDAVYHGTSKSDLMQFLSGIDYVCGHNIVHHDAVYLFPNGVNAGWQLVDTLNLSPLLFPNRPYHRLVKDDKLVSDDANNPVNDCLKARDLLMDEISAWNTLDRDKQNIFTALLCEYAEFCGFLSLVGASCTENFDVVDAIKRIYSNKICENADISAMVSDHPCELAYALALIDTTDSRSIMPGWVLINYPKTEHIVALLRNKRCVQGCSYCESKLNINANLKRIFGYSHFRTYEGEPLQQKAVQAAVDGKSLLAIFPTGGGKSLTFQLPALMQGESVHGLTVVISPLQSLMKDQVDTLIAKGITQAETINGLLDPLSRAMAIQRVADGEASILYISPEMLRSSTIERILLHRHVVRFVIDEAHCFSAWGQDFRVDYLYIGVFIKKYIEKKGLSTPIPVSCFTATAKQKVIQDICDYFNNTAGLNLQLFTTAAGRTNLRYSVIHVDSDEDKYLRLRSLIADAMVPTIVYVSRTKRTSELAQKLTTDGISALPYNGRMDSDSKIANQEAFMSGSVDVIVATSAFGMGVDKSDVGLVVHYDISDSLENYVQEAGRAGRDPNLSARCYVLYNDKDLDKHFILLNQTKLSLCEIQQVWKAVKDLSRNRDTFNSSALEIARQAGWDDSVNDIETRVRTALSTLEQGGYIERGNNMPRVYATGITVKNMDEARMRITGSNLFDQGDAEKAIRVIKSLISQKYITNAQSAEAESRVDYLADLLGLSKHDVISVVERMRMEGILADSKDITAYFMEQADGARRALARLEQLSKIEKFLLESIPEDGIATTYKLLNDNAIKSGLSTAKEKDLRTVLYFLSIKGYVRKTEANSYLTLSRQGAYSQIIKRHKKRLEISRLAVEWLYQLYESSHRPNPDDNSGKNTSAKPIQFSIVKLYDDISARAQFFLDEGDSLHLEDIEESLLYLSKIGVLKLEGGFLVIYNAMKIKRLKDLKYRYKQTDYSMLDEFYKLKIQQIHIVGEYANLMVRDYEAALQYVKDYFAMDYRKFISKYFKGERAVEIQRNLTPGKYSELFDTLSKKQYEIISDDATRCIVVAAGPGSGKTRVLVHKLASLLLLEDVKHEQLLMLTFSRSAATEFKQRLIDLIGNAAHFVDIKTFHSYCFDLLGRVGNLEDAQDVVRSAKEMIEHGEVEPNRICKSVLVIDEAQDMGEQEYGLVKALMSAHDNMRVIVVGDDDQGIYEFRGSNPDYMFRLAQEPDSRLIEMTENFRSQRHIVTFGNDYVKKITRRLKHTPIVSMSQLDGWVEVVKHASKHLYLPIANRIMQNRGSGITCVLTQTNDEAVVMVGLLRKLGIKSELIQTMGGLKFWNLAEIRYLLKYIHRHVKSPIISDELWDEAFRFTAKVYQRSKILPYLYRCKLCFEKTNKTKYLSDFKDFLFESSFGDFVDTDSNAVIVSTIHKAKGCEFDDVYLLISERPDTHLDDTQMRRLYVGMTRAKNRLFVHTNSDWFNQCNADRFYSDPSLYDMPDEVVLQLTHRDVYLDFFKNVKRDVLSCQSGDELIYRDLMFYTPSGKAVAKLSTSMQSSLAEWLDRGYSVGAASVRFIVSWRPKDHASTDPEFAVLLPDLTLQKSALN